MISSLSILTVYALLLVAALLTPYAASRFRLDRLASWPLCACLLFGAVFLTAARHSVPFLCAALIVPLVGLGMGSLLGGVAAALLFATVIWWSPTFLIYPDVTPIFVALALVAGFLPRWKWLSGIRPGPDRLGVSFLLCTLAGLMVGLLTPPFEAWEPFYTAWHHWSALLAPAEAWRGGGVPYRDFPIQYGLGPTTLLFASCAGDCWRGMFYTAIICNALYFATLAGCAILLTAHASRGVRWLALAALFCACFLWTGFPIQFAGPVITPAVAGMRFLTISALLFHILLAEHRQVRRDWIGHAIWLAGLFWSPEAGFFATAIWWPYLAMRDADEREGGPGAFVALVRGACRGLVALALGGALLLLTLWLLSDRSITAEAFLAYIQHPPGMRPIKPTGTIWIALSSITLAVAVLTRQGFSSSARCFYVCLLGFLAAGVYYLSRSHDNNILNLFPLLVLVLLATLAGLANVHGPAQAFIRAFIHTTLAAMVAFVTTFNYGPWREGLVRVGLNLGPESMLSRLAPTQKDVPAILSPDAVAGLEYLRSRDAGVVVLLDWHRIIPRAPSDTAWTGVNNVANFEPLPGATILQYIRAGAAAYRRSGWILVGPGFTAWARAFQTAYDVQERKSFGSYEAYYLSPRPAGADAALIQQAAEEIDRTRPSR